jgi:hypothetical protein
MRRDSFWKQALRPMSRVHWSPERYGLLKVGHRSPAGRACVSTIWSALMRRRSGDDRFEEEGMAVTARDGSWDETERVPEATTSRFSRRPRGFELNRTPLTTRET